MNEEDKIKEIRNKKEYQFINSYDEYTILLKDIWKEAQKEQLDEVTKIFSNCFKNIETFAGSKVFSGETRFNYGLFEKKLLKLIKYKDSKYSEK